MEVGTENRKSFADLTQQLTKIAHKLEFFQAVRLLENAYLRETQLQGSERVPSNDRKELAGTEVRLQDSLIRFRSWQSLAFAASDLHRIRVRNEHDAFDGIEMTVSFMGLTGPVGVLPAHYSSLVIARSHSRNKDYALRDFLDLLNHRSIAYFYQAWKKYRLPMVYERQHLLNKTTHQRRTGNSQATGEDPITQTLASLAGVGTKGLRQRTAFRDEVFMYFGGLFAARTRNATSLEQMLTAFFRVSMRVVQLCERWIHLNRENQSGFARHGNMTLGANVIAGSRIRDIQSLFRIEIGPLDWERFMQFMPGHSDLAALVDLVHTYAGIDLDFEIQLQVHAHEIPSMQLARGGENPMALGQSTWLGRTTPGVVLKDVCFRHGLGGTPF